MQPGHLIQRRFVKSAAYQPAFGAVTEEVALTQVLDPDQSLVRIVIINLRRVNPVGLEKFCDRDVVPIFFALQIVFHEDERLLRRAIHSIEFSVRAAFLDWRDFYLFDIETRKMHSRLTKQEIGSHGPIYRYCDGRRSLCSGSGQYNP